ncbi:hypothetical protein FC32_GL001070 [Ligilactobacillus apodemi DSM 16634 = JCM 16172]|uniref:Fungal lipase-type domain-containing protein n=1 Tax=Ligilactobacillus apodemi DSM 16634 = JCM 16172 TaxID=1423724 RepID=A0A0R1TR21_9LACO|nr:hypothetical protein FC32_GL001070 [Ligilactobacillus apodemi DSM 16634 = JCM 16172]
MAKEVYLVDPKKGLEYYIGKKLDCKDTEYEILDISRNGTYGDKNQYGIPNHMQAMAVAPIKDGVVDYSQITIAYAGTNPEDGLDLLTDAFDVADVDGSLSRTKKMLEVFEPPVSQFDTALGYANYIQAKYPQAKLAVTGHSLGGSLALTVGAKKKLKTVTFNAPIPKDRMSKADQEYILKNPTKVASYLNADDLIGNYNNSYTIFGGKLSGSFQHYYKNGTGFGDIDLLKTLLALPQRKLVLKNGQTIPLSKDELWDILNKNYDVSGWFDENSNFKYAQGKLVVPKTQADFESTVSTADSTLATRLQKFQGLKQSYGQKYGVKGGKIKLDAALACTLKDAIKAHGQAGIEVIQKTEKEEENKLEMNWQNTLQAAKQVGTELSAGEILAVLKSAGAAKSNLYEEPAEKLAEKIKPLEKIKSELATYDKSLAERIEKRIADDQELAQEFGIG